MDGKAAMFALTLVTPVHSSLKTESNLEVVKAIPCDKLLIETGEILLFVLLDDCYIRVVDVVS